jgi:hypothetical protein
MSPAVTAALIALAISVLVTPATQLWLLNRRHDTDLSLALLSHRLLAARGLATPLIRVLDVADSVARRGGYPPPDAFTDEALMPAYDALKDLDTAMAEVRLMYGLNSDSGQAAIDARVCTEAAFRAALQVKAAVQYYGKTRGDQDRDAAAERIAETGRVLVAEHGQALGAVVKFEEAARTHVETRHKRRAWPVFWPHA